MKIMEFIPRMLESHELFTGHHVRHTVKYVELISRELVKEGHYNEILTEQAISVYSAAANLHVFAVIYAFVNPAPILFMASKNSGKLTEQHSASFTFIS